jgi:hypothetical protein
LVLSYSALDSLSYTLNDTDDEEEEEGDIGTEDNGNVFIVVDGE